MIRAKIEKAMEAAPATAIAIRTQPLIQASVTTLTRPVLTPVARLTRTATSGRLACHLQTFKGTAVTPFVLRWADVRQAYRSVTCSALVLETLVDAGWASGPAEAASLSSSTEKSSKLSMIMLSEFPMESRSKCPTGGLFQTLHREFGEEMYEDYEQSCVDNSVPISSVTARLLSN